MKPLPRHDEEDSEEEPARPIISPRAATPQLALLAIAFVFFLGVAIGFALARTV